VTDLAAASVTTLCLQFCSEWLSERTGATVRLGDPEPIAETNAVLARGEIGAEAAAVVLAHIVPPVGEGAWYRAKSAIERLVSARVEGAYLVWAPQQAELPEREPHRSEVVLRLEETLGRFVPGGRGEARFSVSLYLRKSDEAGSYVSAVGGLAPSWAQFTNRVPGHFQLDSTQLHRLPAGEGRLNEVIEAIVQVAAGAELGRTIEVPAEDAWVAHRLRAGTGVAIVGEPPGSELAAGAGLRRSLRRTVQRLREPLLAADGLRLICFVGPYTAIDQQPVSTALLGFDPALYHGLDLLCLAAEGAIRPMLDLTHRVPPKTTG
jgi:hypothetical protein